jgi:hypothetical protein
MTSRAPHAELCTQAAVRVTNCTKIVQSEFGHFFGALSLCILLFAHTLKTSRDSLRHRREAHFMGLFAHFNFPSRLKNAQNTKIE